MNRTTWVTTHSLKTNNFLHIAFMDNKSMFSVHKLEEHFHVWEKKNSLTSLNFIFCELQFHCSKVSTSLY